MVKLTNLLCCFDFFFFVCTTGISFLHVSLLYLTLLNLHAALAHPMREKKLVQLNTKSCFVVEDSSPDAVVIDPCSVP